MLRQQIIDNLHQTITKLYNLQLDKNLISLDIPKHYFGDYATNIAFYLAKKLSKDKQEVATEIMNNLQPIDIIEKYEAVDGFLNFYLKRETLYNNLSKVLKEKENYGKVNLGDGKKVQIEFVSANPTGPLHIGNGRGGVIGDVLSNLLKFVNFDVTKEYYVNDAEVSTQIEKLATSIDIRYKQLLGEKITLLPDAYQGDYIVEIAHRIIEQEGDKYIELPQKVRLDRFKKIALDTILNDQIEDLSNFGIKFDVFFSEEELYKNNKIEEIVNELKTKGYTYEKEGAVWFKASLFGDEKDRVLIRKDNKPTYFAADIAYHKNKFLRGFDRIINIWGADHHAHVIRLKAAIEALGLNKDVVDIIIYQLVNLFEGQEPLKMSKRTASFVTLKELIEEVGKDVARFFFITQDYNNAIDFDLQLAKQQSLDNPVYYVQYAYCRINSIFKEAAKKNIKLDEENINFSLLKEEEEIELLKKLLYFTDIIVRAVQNLQVHILTYYVKELASIFHTFYQKHRVITQNTELTNARLALIKGIQIVLGIIFDIIGIEKVEKM